MKFSIYNTVIPLSTKCFLLYNSYTNIYLVLSAKFKKAYYELPIESIKHLYPLFYNQLIKTRCIIEDEIDEALLIENRIKMVDENKNSFLLTINPTISCNFKCWYCYEDHQPKSRMNEDVLSNIKLLMTNIANKNELANFNLSFFGGEPLLHYWNIVLPIIEEYNHLLKLKSLNGYINFTTNGYLISDKMIESMILNNVNSFQITLDGYRDLHDKIRYPYKGGKSFDRITSNIVKLLNSGFNVVLRLNYTSQNIENMLQVVRYFESLEIQNKNKLTVNFQQVWQDRECDVDKSRVNTIVDNCMLSFDKIGIQSSHKAFNFVWNSCYADKKNQLVVHYNGNIYKCTARDFNEKNKLGFLDNNGEVNWNKSVIEKWANIRFTNLECRKCRIAGICSGGCTQRHLENIENNSCYFGYCERDKDNVVRNLFFNHIVLKS